MIHAEESGPLLLVPNQIAGRTEVYMEIRGREVMVGSMPGHEPTESEIFEISKRLQSEIS